MTVSKDFLLLVQIVSQDKSRFDRTISGICQRFRGKKTNVCVLIALLLHFRFERELVAIGLSVCAVFKVKTIS